MKTFMLTLAVLLAATNADARRRAVDHPTVYPIVLMELYTPETVAKFGGGDPAVVEMKIRRAVSNLNADIRNSGIDNVFVVLAYVGMKDFGGKVDYDLFNELFTSPEIKALRETWAADLVGVWHTGTTGLGAMPNPIEPTAVSGYHIVPFTTDIDNHILSHEFGHNMGINHDDGDPYEPPYGYARGYCRNDPPAFRDLVATCQSTMILAEPLARMFSNPDILFNGVPAGTPINNGAAMIRRVAPYVSRYMGEPNSNLRPLSATNADFPDVRE